MVAVERALDRGTRRGDRACRDLGEDFRSARVTSGWSQQRVADSVGISRSHYLDIEHGRARGLSIVEASRIAAVLGLDLSARTFPGSGPLRDGAHAARLSRVATVVAAPLRARLEVPLPRAVDRPEGRAWDLVVTGLGHRTAMELEMRVGDAQALERRLGLKRRDDPVDQFVLLLAGTRTNRRALAEHPALFADLPRLGPRAVLRPLAEGRHPPSCLILL